MKTTIYLHIGSCKTGTSYIQNFLDLNRLKLFSDHACLYPNFSSSDFVSGRCHNHVQWSLEKFNDESKLVKEIDHLINFCNENQVEKVIISNEGWLNFIRTASNLLKTINKVRNYDLIAICYLRRIDHWIKSAWKQWGLKEYDTIEEFIEDPQFSIRYQLYFNSIETWANIIGEDKIIIRPYEKEQLKRGLIFDFLFTVGIDPESDQWIKPEPTNLARNPGFTQDALEMLHYSRGLLTHQHDNHLFDLFFELLGDKYQKPPFVSYSFLSPAQRSELIEKNKDYEQLIAERYMKRSDGKIFYEQTPNCDDPSFTPYEGLNLKKAVPILVKMIDENNRLIHVLKCKIENLEKQSNRFDNPDNNSMDNQQSNKSTLDKRQRKSIKNMVQFKPRLKILGHIKEYLFLIQSGQFNRDFYRHNNSDLPVAKFLPIVHYIITGWKESKNPSPNFDTNYYLEYNPDVKQAEINPFYHYLRWGKKEGRIPQKTNEITHPFYYKWIDNFCNLSSKDIKLIEKKITQLEKQPNFLLLQLVLDFDKQKITKSIQAVKAQLYKNWKLIILIPPNVHEDNIHEYLSSVSAEPQILIRTLTSDDQFPNVMDPLISTTSADYLCFLDQNVVLAPHALYMSANKILEDENVDLIYFDEDRLDENGNRFDPYLKPDWNLDLFKSQNFIGSFFVLSIAKFVNNFRLMFNPKY